MPSSLGIQVEIAHSPHPAIARLPTARTAFVGRTLRGPVGRPVLIANFTEFQRVFGGLWQPSCLGYSVEQFFDNGGQEAFVVRVANGARAATLSLPAGVGELNLRAARPGTREYLRACVDYDNMAPEDGGGFNLTVQRVRTQGAVHVEDQEIFRSLSVDPAAPRFIGAALARSEMVRAAGPMPAQRPDRTIDAASGLATGYVYSNADGDDGAPLTDYDLIGSAVDGTGLFALRDADDFNFLCIPPIARGTDLGASTLVVAARFCRDRRALLIVDPPSEWRTAADAISGLERWGFTSENALMHFPRILAYDKLRGRFESFAPCGVVAGLLARGDAQSPIWDVGGAEDLVMRPGYKPECQISDRERAKLAALGVNAIESVRTAARRSARLRTLAAWGAAESRFLRARRAGLFIVNCIARGTRWAASAPPTAHLDDAVEAQVRKFLLELFGAGAFAGRGEDDAFFVKCDRRFNDAAAGGARRFRLLIGFAAARIGEFHTFRITHSVDHDEVQAVTLNRLHDLRYSPAEIEWADRVASQLNPAAGR